MASEKIPRLKLRRDPDKPAFSTEALSELIAGALPRRKLAVKRDALIHAIVERVETWIAAKPLIGSHADKIRKLVAIVDKLNSAVEAAGAALLKLGVDREIESAKAERVAMGIAPDAASVRRLQRRHRLVPDPVAGQRQNPTMESGASTREASSQSLRSSADY